jgi:hypothetical protein
MWRLIAKLILISCCVAGCKSANLEGSASRGPLAKTEVLVLVKGDLSPFRLVEIEDVKNGVGAEIQPKFLDSLRGRIIDELAAAWLFEAITPVEKSEIGREFAPTIVVRGTLVSYGSERHVFFPINELAAEFVFLDKKDARELGRYRMYVQLKGKPPFGEEQENAQRMIGRTVTSILHDHTPRPMGKTIFDTFKPGEAPRTPGPKP